MWKNGLVRKVRLNSIIYIIYLYAVNILKNLFSTNFLSFTKTIHVIHVFINNLQSPMTSFQSSTAIQLRNSWCVLWHRVWHRRLLFKLKQNGVSGKLFQLKGTWGQNNNFCLKWPFLIIKQNGINQNFQKFTCKAQLAYYMYSLACMTSLRLRHYLNIQNFATS